MENEREFDRELFLSSPLFFEIKRLLVALVVFAVSAGLAHWLYSQTLPVGIPWGVGVRVQIDRSVSYCALAAGFVGTIANRHFGWRVGMAAALAWIFMPWVWNGAILGKQVVEIASVSMAGIWVLHLLLLWVTLKMRGIWFAMDETDVVSPVVDVCGEEARRKKANDIVSWSVLGAAVIFSVASLWLHDYKLGEPASAYARGIVAMAGDRVIVLNGICDEQVEGEVRNRRGEESDEELTAISLTGDEAHREKVLAWVRREWPNGTNLWMAAHVGVESLLNVAVKAYPDRFYVMNGGSETQEQWESRWTEFAPYLKSSDRFVRIARRAFAYEGNAIANEMRDKGVAGDKAAWRLYRRICTEVEHGNIAALVNMSEMIRRGFVVTEQDRRYVLERVNAFLSNERNLSHAGEIARMAGPVKSDHELVARMSELAQEQLAAAQASGKRYELTAEEKMLVEQNNAMIRAMDGGDWDLAGALARKILSGPRWYGYVHANAVMGDLTAMSGDYVSSEAFYRIATFGTNEVPVAVWNNFADTLLHLGKTDEAEVILRKSIARTDETFWFPRITLAEVLTQKVKKMPAQGKEADAIRQEVRDLAMSVMTNAPADTMRLLREKQRKGDILK